MNESPQVKSERLFCQLSVTADSTCSQLTFISTGHLHHMQVEDMAYHVDERLTMYFLLLTDNDIIF
jgi:hypothetical protein